MNFPDVDVIPLPAPVWLFKFLHILTLGLHFIAVQMLLGGLLVAIVLAFIGGRKQGDARGRILTATSILAKRLPIVMTFVINLGVPPLLFAQVLYGRALYTSSILIGVYWIAVIPLLMLCYWLLYRFAQKLEVGKICWWIGGASWLLAGAIAKIYSTNMTLMLRPEVWQGMYQSSATGLFFPPHDPTIMPRWLLMVSGGIMVAGLWMLWIAPGKNLEEATRQYLHKLGGAIAAGGALVYVNMGLWAFAAQPEGVKTAIASSPIYKPVGILWTLLFIAVFLVGISSFTGKLKVSVLTRWVAGLSGALLTVAMVVLRDGVRDVTLFLKGFDVWHRAVVTNWSVVALFLVLFVIGLVVVGWLISVVLRAQPVKEEVSI